jgi:hypothetical protein
VTAVRCLLHMVVLACCGVGGSSGPGMNATGTLAGADEDAAVAAASAAGGDLSACASAVTGGAHGTVATGDGPGCPGGAAVYVSICSEDGKFRVRPKVHVHTGTCSMQLQ